MEHMAHMKSVGGNEDDTRKSFKKSKAQDTIKRPSNLSKVTVGDIRCHLGLDGPEGDQEWNRIRSTLRRCLTAGKIEWSKGWRDQKLHRLIRIYDAVDEACPAMRQFENQWATQFLAKEYFASHKTYGSCAFNPDTCRGRHRCKHRVVLQSPPSGTSRSQTPVAGSSGMTGQTRRDNSGEQDIDMAAIPQDLPLLTDCEDEEGSEGEERRDVIGKGKGKAVEQPTRGRGRGRGRRH
ncbi:hypothetical protein E1B28_004653 [Marasmius oreades]|uniref:Uncharacterized protein n=1 Tax=Marasmius oreades TaxID=181124 RepID=A0A9P8ADA8_9AGAR|nr:uncharacterized protein E1B28_004653 [Marasmius oreades]KAG7097288.1 hypothetical protein E1B28_004653 [Marasmius oreades]